MKASKFHYLLALLLILFSSQGFCDKQLALEKYIKMKHSLMTCYRVDETNAENILIRFIPYLDNLEIQNAIEDFISLSYKFNIDFHNIPKATTLLPNDAVLVAPQYHEILFESPFVRILWASSQPGEVEPFHLHQWKGLLFMIQSPEFSIEYADGTHENGTWPIGVYDTPPDAQPAQYTNLGPCNYTALKIEIKE